MLLHQTTSGQVSFHSVTSFRTAWLSYVKSRVVKAFGQTSLALLPVLMLFLQAQTSRAQFDQSTQHSATEADSSRGYWRLNTQATSRSTLVQFFGPNHQLLYVENLPEKWVKLSRKNQKQFDQLLEQLLANQLVTSRIKTESLPPTPAVTMPPNVTVRSNAPQYSPSTIASYRVNAYVNQAGKLYLIVDNPERLRYKISVVDQGNRALYEEFTNHNQYRRRLDLSAIPNDSYQVIVQIGNQPFIYKIRRKDARFAYSIQPGPVVSKEATNAQNQEKKTSSLMPVNIDL